MGLYKDELTYILCEADIQMVPGWRRNGRPVHLGSIYSHANMELASTLIRSWFCSCLQLACCLFGFGVQAICDWRKVGGESACRKLVVGIKQININILVTELRTKEFVLS